MPQLPQFWKSLFVSTHVLPHIALPPGPHGPTTAASVPASVGEVPLVAQLDAAATKPSATIACFENRVISALWPSDVTSSNVNRNQKPDTSTGEVRP